MARPPPPPSRVKPPPKPSFDPEEQDTAESNDLVSRWRMIAWALRDVDDEGQRILTVVAAALADMPPTEPELLIRFFDRMQARQKDVFTAAVHSLIRKP